MTHTTETFCPRRGQRATAWAAAIILAAGLAATPRGAAAEQNLLKNPGFEETAPGRDNPPNWVTTTGSAGRARLTDTEAHGGRNAIGIPAHTSVEQRLGSAPAGVYLARCWVKSPTEQPVTFLLQDSDKPWAAYALAEIRVPAGQWVQMEGFCALNHNGSLTLALGGRSKEFNLYHGTAGEMGSPIIADDFELIRYEPKAAAEVAVWDAKKELGPGIDWSAKDQWLPVDDQAHVFAGTPVIQGRHLAGAIRPRDGALAVYAVQEGRLKQRCVIAPEPAFAASRCTVVQEKDRRGIRVSAEAGDRSYTAWFTAKGLIRVEASNVPRFQVRDCRLRYGLLPSFVGTDLCYAPAKMPAGKDFCIPSTQWFVGLVDGNDSLLLAAWETAAVSLGLSGEGAGRLIDSLSIAAGKDGFSLSFAEHAGIWHREPLNEDWLGEYVPIGWTRPFPARWMGRFFVTPGGPPSFREPCMEYAFPIANAKTRMWGVWFEDWNHYPFSFDGPRAIFHFEKSFIPNGEALIYFLEPAAADLFSPCEIVEQALGSEKAAALFDFDANRIRKLKYSTPDEFQFDRPVCATTTRLSKIKQEQKATLGVDLATHLYEFIREIRSRVDQYAAFFARMNRYLASEQQAHPELRDYLAELQALVTDAQAQSAEIYATPLAAVQQKTDSMKALLREGKGDGFNCGNLDVRDTAGAQDDLCRRYNRLVLRLEQTAASKCGDSPEKAVIAGRIWEESRAVLRQPTRWEPRRTLYYSEP
ncbi:MAG TPA: hypothetical protein VN829_23015 [Dongiaceae bacterium]|nr:hypothetical protein [Dongiaceae bacterium]